MTSPRPDKLPLPPAVSLSAILLGALVLALTQLVLVLFVPFPRPGSAGALMRGMLSCLLLPLPGLPAAVLLTSGVRSRTGRGESGAIRPREAVGAFSLTVTSLGCALVIHLVTLELLRLLSVPATALPLSLATLAWCGVGLILGHLQEGLRVVLEPALQPRVLVLGLVAVSAVGFWGRHRLFAGHEAFFSVQPEQLDPIRSHSAALDPDAVSLSFGRGAGQLGPRHFVLLRSSVRLTIENRTPKERVGRLTLAFLSIPDSSLELWATGKPPCKQTDQSPSLRRRLARAKVSATWASLSPRRSNLRLGVLLTARPRLPAGKQCFELRLTGRAAVQPGQSQIYDLSSSDLTSWSAFSGRLYLLPPVVMENRLAEARLRSKLLQTGHVELQHLLWGHLAQIVVQVLAAGPDAGLGILFLLAAYLCFASTLVLMGAGRGDRPPTLASQAAGLLLLAPLCAHLASQIFLPPWAFASADAPCTLLLLAAAALLCTRQRGGFVLLACLAGTSRFLGGVALLVGLLFWLLVQREDRAWTRRALLWTVSCSGLVLALMVVDLLATRSLTELASGVLAELFPARYRAAVPGSPLLMLSRTALLSCFGPLLWPLVRQRPAMLMMLLAVVYAAGLGVLAYADLHHLQPLIYLVAGSGLGAVAASRKRAVILAGVVVTLLGLAAALLLGGSLLGP